METQSRSFMSVMPKSLPHLTFPKWEFKASGGSQSLSVSVLLSIEEKSIAPGVANHLKSNQWRQEVLLPCFGLGLLHPEGGKTDTTKVTVMDPEGKIISRFKVVSRQDQRRLTDIQFCWSSFFLVPSLFFWIKNNSASWNPCDWIWG